MACDQDTANILRNLQNNPFCIWMRSTEHFFMKKIRDRKTRNKMSFSLPNNWQGESSTFIPLQLHVNVDIFGLNNVHIYWDIIHQLYLYPSLYPVPSSCTLLRMQAKDGYRTERYDTEIDTEITGEWSYHPIPIVVISTLNVKHFLIGWNWRSVHLISSLKIMYAPSKCYESSNVTSQWGFKIYFDWLKNREDTEYIHF